DNFRTAIHSISHQCLNFFDRRWRNQRTDSHALVYPVTHLQLLDGCNQLFGKGLVNIGMDVKAVSTDTGLAGIAEFASYGPLYRLIKVCIFKHDKGCIAA